MYLESELVPLSALRQYAYCPRRCGLIHLEQAWIENVYTAAGNQSHEKVHSNSTETRDLYKAVTGLPLRNLSLGLIGKADLVEFHYREGAWHPYPVEHKRGRKAYDTDIVQLCAQAICLEEMLGLPVPEGAIYYNTIRRRTPVLMEEALREKTAILAQAVHALLQNGATPPPVAGKHCDGCSLVDECLPGPLSRQRASGRYLESLRRAR
jgi:CRISPR-associated exonuclease Cas4